MSIYQERDLQRQFIAHRHRIERAKCKVDTSSARLPTTRCKLKPSRREDCNVDFWRERVERIVHNSKKLKMSSNKLRLFQGLRPTVSHCPLAQIQGKERGKLVKGISNGWPNSLQAHTSSKPSDNGSANTAFRLPPIGGKPISKWQLREKTYF